MPQPLNKVNPRANIFLGNAGVRVLSHNPELGGWAMEAIISWSNVESFMLKTYIKLLGGPKENAAIGYLAIDGQSAKSAMITAVAKSVLDDNYFRLLQALLRISKTSQSERDKLAHWTWGFSQDIKDGFILVDPRKNTSAPSDPKELKEFRSRLTEDAYVYKKVDFENLINRNDRICGFFLKFGWILSGHPANQGDELYHQLLKEPEIHERLNPGHSL